MVLSTVSCDIHIHIRREFIRTIVRVEIGLDNVRLNRSLVWFQDRVEVEVLHDQGFVLIN